MRFLRMLSNSVIAGTLASAYLTVLVLHLNPAFPLTLDDVLPLALVMGLAYGVNLAAVFYVLIVLRQLTSAEVLSPGWLSVRLLSWLCTIAAGTVAVIMWLNLRDYSPVLDSQTVTRMTAGAVTMSTSAVVFLLIALAHIGRRGGRVSASLLVAMMAISIAAPLGARGRAAARTLESRPLVSSLAPPPTPSEDRVILMAFDGATLDIISPAVAEGRLPNFGRIFDAGAVLHLATLKPTQAEPVWSAAMTGKRPGANGIRASARYRVRSRGAPLELLPDYCFSQALVGFGFLREEPHTVESLLARPLWSILSDAAIPVGVIGFPLAHPVSAIHGFIVSDDFHRIANAVGGLEAGSGVSPAALYAEVRASLDHPSTPDPEAVLAAIAETPAGADPRPDPAPIAGDRAHLQIVRAMQRVLPTRFTAVRFPGLDAVGHYFFRYANPSAFGDVSEAERRQYGRVLDDYYGFVDAVVGSALESLQPGDLLLVVSAFGMEPLSPGKRVLEQLIGNADISGTHERAPDGFLLAYGSHVVPGRPERASLVDLTPTVLYYLGLPVARDMDGFARTDLFQPSFTASRPVTFIPTYGR
ncbi:MAG TPA: alkaline phosphatase family protein [Vicinamibacterales bacterium]|nr:alkaline phosphatase family protein [Vicinamibacterales bacterium]